MATLSPSLRYALFDDELADAPHAEYMAQSTEESKNDFRENGDKHKNNKYSRNKPDNPLRSLSSIMHHRTIQRYKGTDTRRKQGKQSGAIPATTG
ncbi:MAG TPA: hypothetical protein VNL69_06380 [Bacteroidota bacterium]|nr:hypothetical protein [Bacteroidota bacterium]